MRTISQPLTDYIAFLRPYMVPSFIMPRALYRSSSQYAESRFSTPCKKCLFSPPLPILIFLMSCPPSLQEVFMAHLPDPSSRLCRFIMSRMDNRTGRRSAGWWRIVHFCQWRRFHGLEVHVIIHIMRICIYRVMEAWSSTAVTKRTSDTAQSWPSPISSIL